MSMTNNRVVVDLKKVQWAYLRWKNQYDDTRELRPPVPTVRSSIFDIAARRFSGSETLLDYAKKNKLLDVWTPVLTLQLTANHSLIYTGDKALSIYKSWTAIIFNKQTKKGKK